jgi:hypothetical protein
MAGRRVAAACASVRECPSTDSARGVVQRLLQRREIISGKRMFDPLLFVGVGADFIKESLGARRDRAREVAHGAFGVKQNLSIAVGCNFPPAQVGEAQQPESDRRPDALEDPAVACAIRKPGGEFMVGVPRLVSPTEPPMILGAFPRGGTWLSYEAIFPDFFTDADEKEEFPDGRYVVIWGTLVREGRRSHVLATDAFSWPPNAAA